MSSSYVLNNNHLDRVICQLRYNPIFSVDGKIADLQSMVSSEYPVSGVTAEPPIPLFPTAPMMKNYSFGSRDGHWTINITNTFITLSCSRYVSWDEFRSRFEKMMDVFFSCFEVSVFERVGLRYINTIRPSRLGLDRVRMNWGEMLSPETIGTMGLFGTGLENYTSTVDASMERCRVRSTVGTIRFNDNNEMGFLIDNDLYKLSVDSASILDSVNTLNSEAFELLKRMVSIKLLKMME